MRWRRRSDPAVTSTANTWTLLAAIFALHHDPIVLVDGGMVVYANAATRDLCGCEPTMGSGLDELLGQDYSAKELTKLPGTALTVCAIRRR